MQSGNAFRLLKAGKGWPCKRSETAITIETLSFKSAVFGPVSTIADDGSVPGGVLCAKVPELVQAAMDDFNAIQRALSRGSGPAAIALRAAEKALESAGKEHALNNPLATRPNQYEIAAQEAGKAARAAEMETE